MAELADRCRAGERAARWPGLAAALLLCTAAAAQAPEEGAQSDAAVAEDTLEYVQPPETPETPESPAAGDLARSLVTRFEAQIELRSLVEQGSYEDAVAVAEQVVRLTEEDFGARSAETAEALAELGDVQRRAGLHEESELNFLQAIETYRQVDGPNTRLLVEPLVGLGDNYRVIGQYQSAVSAYNEARTVSRRVYGLLSEEQIPILDRMTEAFLGMNLYAEAGEQQLAALELMERSHPRGSDEAMEAIYKYAEWLRQVGRFREEREQYNRAMQIIRDEIDRDHPKMAKPLREIANSFRAQRIAENRGASSLQRALDILEAQEERDPLTMAEVMRDLGDWEVAFSRVGADGDEYRRAWQLLGEVDNGEQLRAEWFSGARYVLREPVSQRGLSNEPDAVRGHVLVQFDIDESGRTEGVTVVQAEPPGFKDDAVAQSVRRSRFRPQMADGEIIRGEQIALQFVYRYLPGDE